MYFFPCGIWNILVYIYVLLIWDNKPFWFKYKIKWHDGLKNQKQKNRQNILSFILFRSSFKKIWLFDPRRRKVHIASIHIFIISLFNQISSHFVTCNFFLLVTNVCKRLNMIIYYFLFQGINTLLFAICCHEYIICFAW
jgi:hypothetical protein